MRVAYLTDVEGRWDKVEAFLDGNPLVALDAAGALAIADGARLVFGGDAVDRGPAGRRIVAILLDAAERFGDRAILLAGNRDLNKLRLPSEIRTPPERMAREAAEGSRADRLRWLLGNTMNAGQAFEHRRSELAAEAKLADPRRVDDETVVESFLEDLRPDGEHARLLGAMRLAFRDGETLFLHGAVTAANLGVVPGLDDRIETVDGWIAALDDFLRRQLAAWANAPLDEARPGWAPLIAYQAPRPGTRLNQASVVYSRLTDELGNPYLPSRAVRERLLAEGIRRVVVGHTPSGDSPALLRDDADGFELLLADNSYSRLERGARLLLDGDALALRAAAQLDDGRRVDLDLTVRLGHAASPLGRRLADTGHLVKGATSTGELLLFRGAPKYAVEQVTLPPEAIARRPLAVPEPPPRLDEDESK